MGELEPELVSLLEPVLALVSLLEPVLEVLVPDSPLLEVLALLEPEVSLSEPMDELLLTVPAALSLPMELVLELVVLSLPMELVLEPVVLSLPMELVLEPVALSLPMVPMAVIIMPMELTELDITLPMDSAPTDSPLPLSELLKCKLFYIKKNKLKTFHRIFTQNIYS